MPEPSPQKPGPRHRRTVGCLAAVVVVLLGCGAGLGWMSGYLPVQRFDSNSWKNPPTDQTRIRMISALLLTHDLNGMTRAEVIDLLGQPPRSSYFRDWDFVYRLGLERSLVGLDSEWLVLRFGPDGRVSAWALVRD